MPGRWTSPKPHLWSRNACRRRNKDSQGKRIKPAISRGLLARFPVSLPHALWGRIVGGNTPADRFGPAGGPPRQVDAQGPGDVGLLPLPWREIAQLQGRE